MVMNPAENIRKFHELFPNLQEKPFVHQLDMPPMAYFNIPLDHGGTQMILAHEIVSGVYSRHADANDYTTLVTQVITDELFTCGGGIIWWRTRLQVEEDGKSWKVYGRCGTSPTLPDDFWKKLDQRAK